MVHVAQDGHHGTAGYHVGVVVGPNVLQGGDNGGLGALLGLGAIAEGGSNRGGQVEVYNLV